LRCGLLGAAAVNSLATARGAEGQIAAGLAVYRNNVRGANLRVLADAYPVVMKLVGDAFFRFLANAYFHANPPTSPLIARYGDALAVFLESFSPASAHPYLAGVARLEIAWLKSYHAPEADPLLADAICGQIGDDPERALFVFHPSMQLLSSAYPIYAIWSHNRHATTEPLKLP
jgi:hypothetical protein